MAATRDSEEIAGIRQAVRALCAGFPGEYWRTLDRDRAYPTEFVDALTKGGFLAALIPEEYGGSGLTMSSAIAIMEEIQAAGCNGAACHAQMYTMGTVLRHGNAEQKQRYLPKIASGRPAPIRWRCAPPRCATATTATSSTGRRSGPRARNIPT
jgi:acyl-CoA dehydrogenase